MANYADTLAAFDAVQIALADTSTRELLTMAYSLTHKMHAADAERLGTADLAARRRLGTQARDLRAQRDMIDAELLIRTGDTQVPDGA